MLYREIQRRLRELGSTIALNQKKVRLEEELAHLLEVEIGVLQSPSEVQGFLSELVDDRVSLCGPALGSASYWEDLRTNPVDRVVRATRGGETIAFVLLRQNYSCRVDGCATDPANESLYIELVCSKALGEGVGGKLIEYVKQLARKEHCRFVHLSALFDLIPYYAQHHAFQISTDCYPRMAAEVAQIQALHADKETLSGHRTRLSALMAQGPPRAERAAIRTERSRLTSQRKVLQRQQQQLLETLRSVCTYRFKHPRRSVDTDHVLEDGVFMSFCV